MCWLKPIVTASLETGALQLDFENVTCSGSASENAPLVRWPGSDTVSAASPAVEMTSAALDAVYVLSTPGVNAPKLTGPPSVSESAAGTEPPTGAVALVP